MESNELQHHGVKGQRWGVRRYQNKDGTLTKAGKRRYEKELEKLSKEERIVKNKIRTAAKLKKLEDKKAELRKMNDSLKGKKTDKQDDTPDEPAVKASNNPKGKGVNSRTTISELKNVNSLSDDELNTIVKRLQNEQKLKELTPKQESLGKRFVKRVFNDVLVPVATDYAKTSLKNYLNEASKKNKK